MQDQLKDFARSNIPNSSTTSPYINHWRDIASSNRIASRCASRINAIFKGEEMGNLSFVKTMTALAMALMFLIASNVTRVEAAPVNNLTPEQIEAIATEMFNKFAAFDAQGTANMFAPNGTIEDPVGTTPVQGTQAIIAYLESFPTVLNEIRIQSFDVTVAGQEAAIKWRLRFKTRTGNVFFVDGIGILKINEDGKVQSDREYFDLAYFQTQLQQ
jgi:ketosteroid isomerase-like protein